jgi:hypothetical protein
MQTAERLRDAEYQLRALWSPIVYWTYIGDYRSALDLTERFRTIATENGYRAARVSVDRMTATSLRYPGDQAEARRHLDRMLGPIFPADASVAYCPLSARSACGGVEYIT